MILLILLKKAEINKKVTSKKTKNLEAEKKLNSLLREFKLISPKGL